jgi:hypothetical protein
VPSPTWISNRRACVAQILLAFAAIASGCGAITFAERPASGYVYASGAPLRIALIDETGSADWGAAIDSGTSTYASAAPQVAFVDDPANAHIVVTARRYTDAQPPQLAGYTFQPGVAAFVAVYDVEGRACNFPPSPLPLNCSGEIARGDVYLNDSIPAGDDIAERRLRLVLHELGHAMGLTRHSALLDVGYLERRYGW